MRLIAAITLLVLVPISFFAQELTTKVERDQMHIGEINHLIIEHRGALKENDLLEFKLLKAITSHTAEKSEPIEIEVYGVEYTSQIIKIQFTVWDSALVVLPPFALNNSGSFTSQATMFQVSFPDVDVNGDIADIYEIAVETNETSQFFRKFWWLLNLLILVLFVLGLLLVLSIKQANGQVHSAIQLTIDERALKDLEALMQRKLFIDKHQKLHFAEFSDILRRYIGMRYNFITFEKTTNEILTHMRQNQIESRFVEQFGSLLQLADMIKFSKATTDEVEFDRSYQSARNLILETTKIQESQKLEANLSGDQAGMQSPKTKKGEGDE